MEKIDVTKTELVWPGKYNEDGALNEPPRVGLPFQVIETVNESRATREAKKGGVQSSLFDIYEGNEGDTFEAGWRNKLIWGDNLLVLGSLLERFAGKVDLIYIDPPFATGTDFSFTATIGEANDEILKQQSVIEEKAYRDTWGHGLDSYVSMMHQRLELGVRLLAQDGAIFVHCDWHVGHYLKALLDTILGKENFINEIIWQKIRSSKGQSRGFGNVHDTILVYGKSTAANLRAQYVPLDDARVEQHYSNVEPRTGRKYMLDNFAQADKENRDASARQLCDHRQANIGFGVKLASTREWHPVGLLSPRGGRLEFKRYLDQSRGNPVEDIWTDIPPINSQSSERLDYATQKPEALLGRVLGSLTKDGALVIDFFAGSGTTLAVAEQLGHRWIGCDLGRWGIHVTRKRLLGIENCKPFEVLNLGRYERQYWQGVTFGEKNDKALTEQALYEYLAFILKLYGAQPVAGLANLHGKKAKALVHIGAVDAPVTIAEIDAAVDECAKLKQGELHVLGWEWEMGLYDLMVEAARKKGVKLLLLQIPREVMESQAAAKGDVRFFELAFLEAEIKQPKRLTAKVALKDFVIPNTELIPEDVRSKVRKWSDYIDYWAVDWDFRNDTFMQGWVAYRTRKERTLPLASDPHTYEKQGNYRILVKVIDIFGNDTSQAFDVEVR